MSGGGWVGCGGSGVAVGQTVVGVRVMAGVGEGWGEGVVGTVVIVTVTSGVGVMIGLSGSAVKVMERGSPVVKVVPPCSNLTCHSYTPGITSNGRCPARKSTAASCTAYNVPNDGWVTVAAGYSSSGVIR